MSTVNAASPDTVVEMLLLMHMIALGVGLMIFGWMVYLQRHARRELGQLTSLPIFEPSSTSPQRPASWLAIRSVSPESVKDALGLNRAAPCSWTEGIAGGHEFFISPRVHGWVIVTGVGLPNPSENVDDCFIFLSTLSRKLGHVQYFYAEKFSRHHAWARLDDGCVTRAYAWAGETIWIQGIETLPEIEIGVKTFGYGEQSAASLDAETNFEKMPLLAARWSLDPAEVKLNSIRQSIGIAGESAWS
ncbi:MAG: hypothetical protein ABSE48_13670 [Verrucomicrobiota bacterium]